MIDVNKLAKELHKAAVAKGFWDVSDAPEKHFAKMHCELSEAIQEDRCDRPMLYVDDIEELARVTDPGKFDGRKPEGVAVELADFVMMLLDWCAYYRIELPKEPVREWCMCIGSDDHWKDNRLYILVGALHSEISRFIGPEHFGMPTIRSIYMVHEWLRVRGINLWEIVRLKMEYNKSRPELHGRLY